MKILRPFALPALLALVLGVTLVPATKGAPPVPFSTAVKDGTITFTATGNDRDSLTLTLTNPTGQPVTVSIPAGSIAVGASPDSRLVIVRAALADVPAKNAVEVSLPVSALSSKNAATSQAFHFVPETEPRLTALLSLLADQPDAPRATVQLAVLATLEDLHFTQWRKFLGTDAAQPTPAEITQAIDALGLLKTAAPDQAFALAGDSDLKLRALRNPWSRAKAVALYGLDSGDGAAPPDLRQLLHTQPGDNCPICRQRALMQKQADIP